MNTAPTTRTPTTAPNLTIPQTIKLNGRTRKVRDAYSDGPGTEIHTYELATLDVLSPEMVRKIGGQWSIWNGRSYDAVNLELETS